MTFRRACSHCLRLIPIVPGIPHDWPDKLLVAHVCCGAPRGPSSKLATHYHLSAAESWDL